jgi:hypothetical protein
MSTLLSQLDQISEVANQTQKPERSQNLDSGFSAAHGRRSPRLAIPISVELYSQNSMGRVFHVETHTVSASAHGGSIMLEESVDLNQQILLVHRKSGLEVQCRVVYRKEGRDGRSEIGIEFVSPSPRFWGISFPPEDWKNDPYRRRGGSPLPGTLPKKSNPKPD